MKNNISFYRHETGSHNHWKFKTLRRRFGWGGEGKFWALNNMIADAEWCALDLSDFSKKMAVATDLDFDPKGLDEFIQFLIHSCKLLKETPEGLTTDIVQETLEEVNKNREYQRKWKKGKSSSKSENSNSTSGKLSIENEQSKEKESKGKESKKEIVIGADAGQAGTSPPQKTSLEKKQEDMLHRQKLFYQELKPYVERYTPEMLRAFYDYWSEPNKSRTKFRKEMQPTWETKIRLITWEKNNYKFNKNSNSNEPSEGSTVLNEKIKKAMGSPTSN